MDENKNTYISAFDTRRDAVDFALQFHRLRSPGCTIDEFLKDAEAIHQFLVKSNDAKAASA
jgi:hypothetical protein